jgi:hypothetical protein
MKNTPQKSAEPQAIKGLSLLASATSRSTIDFVLEAS